MGNPFTITDQNKQRIVAVFKDADGYIATPPGPVSWESSNPTAATAGPDTSDPTGQSGFAYGVSPGSTTITATATLGDGTEVTDTILVTVTADTATSLVIEASGDPTHE